MYACIHSTNSAGARLAIPGKEPLANTNGLDVTFVDSFGGARDVADVEVEGAERRMMINKINK